MSARMFLRLPARTSACALILAATVALLSGCATPRGPADSVAANATDSWSGRLSLLVESVPPQQYSAAFELRGTPRAGELTLTSPFGQQLARAHWSDGQAVLQRGDDERAYPDLDALTTQLTGTALPVTALFGWLQGQATAADGWNVDLSQLPQGRLRAQRLYPQPAATLRLVMP